MTHDTTPQGLRDLRWALTSPSLIDQSDRSLSVPSDKIVVDADHLSAFLAANPTRRVGADFETLILYWLKHIRKVDVVAHGLQVRQDDRTLGELDFLYRDEAGQLTHLETAVKFYLHFKDDSGTSQWIGPNANDTFDKKMQRLLEHQLPLSEKTHPEVTIRKAFVKGCIFYRPSDPVSVDLPRQMSRTHLRGLWIRHSEMSWIEQAGEESKYQILNKPFWLSSDAVATLSPVFTPQQLIKFIHEHEAIKNRPIQLGLKLRPGPYSRPYDRLFIVPDTWPHT